MASILGAPCKAKRQPENLFDIEPMCLFGRDPSKCPPPPNKKMSQGCGISNEFSDEMIIGLFGEQPERNGILFPIKTTQRNSVCPYRPKKSGFFHCPTYSSLMSVVRDFKGSFDD